MKQTSVICNMCGNKIDEMDLACNGFSINYQFGYGSIHDGDYLNIDLCSECQDKLVTHLKEVCKIDPIVQNA